MWWRDHTLAFEREHLERRERQGVDPARLENHRGPIALGSPGAARRIAPRRVRGQLPVRRHVQPVLLRAIARVAQRQDPLAGRPGAPAVDLEPRGIASHPVRVAEHRGVAARPARRLGENGPVGLREEGGRHVHFLELRAGAEVGADLRVEVAARVAVELLRVPGVDQAVQHERVERVERAGLHDAPEGVGVAVGDPPLAVGPDARKVVVVSAAPDRVGVAQPPRATGTFRWSGSRRGRASRRAGRRSARSPPRSRCRRRSPERPSRSFPCRRT